MKINSTTAAILSPILSAIVLTNAADADGSTLPSTIAGKACRALFTALREVLNAYGFNGEEIVSRLCDSCEFTVEGVESAIAYEKETIDFEIQRAVEDCACEHNTAYWAEKFARQLEVAKERKEEIEYSIAWISL